MTDCQCNGRAILVLCATLAMGVGCSTDKPRETAGVMLGCAPSAGGTQSGCPAGASGTSGADVAGQNGLGGNGGTLLATGGSSGAGGSSGTGGTMGASGFNAGGAAGPGGRDNRGHLEGGGAGISGLGGQAGAEGGLGGSSSITPFSFFAFGDAHSGQNATANSTLQTAMTQMAQLDPDVVMAVSNGDLVEDATAGNWGIHDASIALANFRADLTTFGSETRYLATTDNHDRGFPFPRSDWLTQWDEHLSGQRGLGHDASDGVYYSVRYANVLFIMLDSVRPSTAQTSWLASLLSSAEASSAPVKLAFFHEPAYVCNTEHPPFAGALPWIDLFEKNGVHLAFVSHMHQYNRTCPLFGGACRTDGSGVVYEQLGPLSATNFRSVNMTTASVSGVDAAGNPRTDQYACSGANNVFVASKTNVNDFCHVSVDGCRVSGDCYAVGSGSTPFDSWEVNACD